MAASPHTGPVVLGREFMGVVEEVGDDVRTLRVGDRVIVPAPVVCGTCWFCSNQLAGHCEAGVRAGVAGGGLAERVRVPFADVGPRKVPDGLSDEQVLFLAELLPTGWAAVDWGQPHGGETVVVVGCGPVGLMAMKSAWLRGAGRVIGVDRQRYRLEVAERVAGAEVVHADDSDDVGAAIAAFTAGRMADIVIDATGLEDRVCRVDNVLHLQLGSIGALRTALSAVRDGGTVSAVGVGPLAAERFPVAELKRRGIALRMGEVPVHLYIDELLRLIEAGRLRVDDVISHRMPLRDGAAAFQLFSRPEERCLKVVLSP